MRRSWLTAACVALLPLAAQTTRAAEFPQYEAAPCCQLCPAAADPAAYNTKFLNSFRTLVQGNDGWLFRSEADLLTDFAPDAEGLNRFMRLHRALRERGVELVMMIQPPRGLMHADKLDASVYDADAARASYLRTLHGLRANGVVVPPLEKLLEEKGTEDYFWRTDHHWTAAGTRRTAQIVAEQVRAMTAYADVRRQKFVTRREGLVGRRGTLSKAALELCGFGAAHEYMPRFVTESAGAGTDLFGDESVPQVTLIGTSNSGPIYNFSGFLSEYLEADVLNASVLGGGMDGAILSYLSSEEFRSNPPKILIWELQHFHKLGDPEFHRQVLPLLDDGCNGKPAVLEREVTLRQGANEVLFNGGGAVRTFKGRDYVLDIQFADPSVLELRGVVWYTSGNKDALRLEHSQHAPSHKGRFVTALRDDANWAEQTFLGLDIEVVPPEPGTEPRPAPTGPQRVRARLCEKRGGALTASAPITASEVLR
jgi:alginate biosynthesis protein AlgX